MIDRRRSQIEGEGWAVCARKPANLVLSVSILRYDSRTDTTGDVVSQRNIPIPNPGHSAKYPDKYIAVVACKKAGFYATAVSLEVYQPPALAAYPHRESPRLRVSDKKQCSY
jgi:hypothetical protein